MNDDMNDLLDKLGAVERMAQASKWQRLLARPFRYAYATGFKEFVYPRSRKGILKKAHTFFGPSMAVVLPSSTDIYLTGGKSHGSEIRLARLLIRTLTGGDTFVDVGAHYGYFTLLASRLVGPAGRVLAFEASAATFATLEENTRRYANIACFHRAASDRRGTLTFYEFPVLFSEYNSLEIDQFREASWFRKYPPQPFEVQALPLDDCLGGLAQPPKVIKIDVEGAELQVIRGSRRLLEQHAPLVVMEYLEPGRHNEAHGQAAALLAEWGYEAHFIDAGGALRACSDVDAYLRGGGHESDNIVFVKNIPAPEA
jgi:FkbM family methyltransferase